MLKKHSLMALAVAVTFSFTLPNSLFAVGSAGFENAGFSAKTVGQANAVVARPQDPSTMSFNAAGLTEIPGVQFSGTLSGLNLRVFHRNQVTGDHNQNNGQLLLIPDFYLTAHPEKWMDGRYAMGFSMNSPFGLSTKFPSIGMGRYTGYKNFLKMLATNLSGAMKVNEELSIGGGATNYWAYKYGQILNYPNANILGAPGTRDGRALIEGDGFGWGWNLGILYKPSPKHRLGFSYRSKADVETHGRVLIDDLVNGLAQGYDTAPHFQSGAHSHIILPQNLTLGYAYVPSDKWSAEVDFSLTGWGAFKHQDYEFDRNNATLRGLGTIPRDYHDTFNLHLGGQYKVKEDLDLMGGFFFYEGAAPKKHVDNFLPDADRYGWSLGTSYQLNEKTSIDCAYLFILYATRHISNPQIPAKGGENIDGRYTSILNGFYITLNYRFDSPSEKKVATEPAPKISSFAQPTTD